MKYLCLAYETEQALNELTHEQWLALRQETLDYAESIRRSGHLLATEALQSARKAKTTKIRNGKVAITDGPFAETKEQIGGYFLIEANNFEEAMNIATGWPSARLGLIEVRPIEDGLREEGRYD